jgi:FkbM family methyltransferase
MLVYVPQGIISGIDFREDLKHAIGNEHPVCLDVGANEGQTIDLFQRVFDRPTIHAFEPSSKMFQILQLRDFCNRVSLHNFALGNEIKKQEFINYKDSCLSSFLPLDIHEDNPFCSVEIESRELIEITTVDIFLQQNRIGIVDLLKIDTQGFDLAVLLGAEGALQSGVIQNVLVELNFVQMYTGQSSALEIIDFLAKYNIFLIDYYEKVRQGKTLAWCTALFGKRLGNS